MAFLQFARRSFTGWTPALYNTDEIYTAIAVDVGDVVGPTFCRIRVAFNGTGADATVEIGDGATRAGYVTTTQTAATSTSFSMGNGAYFANAPGKLYTTADTVDINCITDTNNDGSTGTVDLWCYVAKAFPG